MNHKYIAGYGPIGARILILRECPTMREHVAGKMLDNSEILSICKEAGINTHSCYQTFVCKYHVPPNSKKGNKVPFQIRAKNIGIDIPECLNELQGELNTLKPNVVLAFGSTALWALTGKFKIDDYRGSILLGMGVKLVATYDPSQLSWACESPPEFIGYWNRAIMLCDIKRARDESHTPELNRQSRTIEICNSSEHLNRFYKEYSSLSNVATDIESSGTCVPTMISFAFNKYHSMAIPLWNTEGLSSIPSTDMIQIWILVQKILNSHGIIGQNWRGYDTDKLRGIGFSAGRLVDDVMFKCYAINPELPVGLAFNTSVYTREPFYKNEGMYKGSQIDLLLGCGRDSCVTYEINENTDSDLDEISQRDFYRNFLMALPDLYLSIQNQGFKIDSFARDRLMKKYIEWDERIRYELFRLTGTLLNVNSYPQVSTLLYDTMGLPRKKGTGEEDITDLLNSSKVKNDSVRKTLELILEDRRVRKTISSYLMAMPDFDGRMRTTYFLCLKTGRTSTGQQDVPIRPKVNIKTGEIGNGKTKDWRTLGIAFQTMTKHGDIGSDVREMYVPDSEYEEFLSVDSAQAEARVIFLLANDEEALIDIDTRDYHALTASWFFGGTEEKYSKKILGYEHPIRFVGKTLRHAGHLGAGKKRAAISVNTDARKFKIDIKIDESIAERALKIFHTKQPKIQRVFQDGIIECLKKGRTLIAGLPYGIDSDYGGRRTFYERWGDDLFREAFSYIPQRSVTDNTKAAALRIRNRIPNIKIVMESHDGLLFCTPKIKRDEYSAIIKQEMERPIDFSNCSLPRRSLVIPAEIEVGDNYKDLKKYNRSIAHVNSHLEVRALTSDESKTEIGKDTKRDGDIYYHTVEKKERSFYVE